nr:retrotransposon protein, putative, Ty1-copia subclass [Tanacetum cinerariifolium]
MSLLRNLDINMVSAMIMSRGIAMLGLGCKERSIFPLHVLFSQKDIISTRVPRNIVVTSHIAQKGKWRCAYKEAFVETSKLLSGVYAPTPTRVGEAGVKKWMTNTQTPPPATTVVNPICAPVTNTVANQAERPEKFNDDAGTKKFVVARFLNYKMVDSKKVISHVQDLEVLIYDIHAEGMTLSENFQVFAIIEKLPPSWVDFKNYLKHKRKEMSVEDLVVRLRIEENNMLNQKDIFTLDSAKANMIEHVGSSLRSNPKGKGKDKRKNDKKNIRKSEYHAPKAWIVNPRQANMVNDDVDMIAMVSNVCAMISEGEGDVVLKMTSEKELKLTNVLYVLEIRKNLVSGKYEAIDKFVLYKIEVENQLGKKIKVVRSDRGGEYVSLFAELCAKHGIRHEFTAPYSPQQNAKVAVPTPKAQKIGPKSVDCIFIGYAKNISSYRFIVHESKNPDIQKNTVMESRNASFFEHIFPCLSKETGSSFILDDEVVQDKRQQDDNDLQAERQDQTEEEEVKPRRSKRAREREIVWTRLFLLWWKMNPRLIEKRHTWELVDLPRGCKPLGYKWIFKKKMKADGIIDKYKARLIIKRFRQREGLDYFDTYSPVTRITSIRMILAIVALINLEVHQMDVKMAFLNEDLEEEIYMNQPEESGFKINECDKCVYVKDTSSGYVVLCLYVDDMLIVVSNDKMIKSTKDMLKSKFDMKDMGLADVILGIKIIRPHNRLVLSQAHYVDKILNTHNAGDSGLARTLIDTSLHLSKIKGVGVAQLKYSRIIGMLMYLMTSTRPDLASVVSRLSRYTSNSDANWISDIKDSRSTSGYVFTLGGAAISWKSSKQTVIAKSTIESEFTALDKCREEAEWLRQFVKDIPRWPKPVTAISIHCDGQLAIGRAHSTMYNGKSKHIRRQHNSIRQLLSTGVISIDYVASKDNIADPFTKGLSKELVNHGIWIMISEIIFVRMNSKRTRSYIVSTLLCLRKPGRVVSLVGVNDQGNQNDDVQDVGAHVIQDEGVNLVSDKEVEATAADKPKRNRKKRKTAGGANGSNLPLKKLRGDHVGVTAMAMLPFVTSYMSLTPEREEGGRTNSVIGPNLRTQLPTERFVVLSDSPCHSSSNTADAEVSSIVRSPVLDPPILTTVVATMVVADII